MINFEQYLLERKGSIAGQQPKRKVNIEQLKEMIANKDPKMADVDVSEIADMSELFQDSDFGGSWTADLSEWDISKVEDVRWMFAGCKKLKEVSLPITRNVKYMFGMFQGCTSLKEVRLHHTENVVNMQHMFKGCTKLTKVELPHTENVRDMGGMFWVCASLKEVSLPNTGNVTNMESMFYGCEKLIKVELSSIENVVDMSSMFKDCENLEQDFTSWDVRGIVRESMFLGTKVTKFPEGYEQ